MSGWVRAVRFPARSGRRALFSPAYEAQTAKAWK